ncbi:Transcriptional regulator of ribosomal biogenesis proteins [Physocladia obscura]|uniref:Transcriptional regulator of ribosomal biogenesis proteins n=1 Tax=Physocladia obscura TaxID=109957 RepID=A0AAD5T0A2_9FUNG|nr:Transcriptional regulator of ribosomal biogenesis proteins [Physocladia obscura]
MSSVTTNSPHKQNQAYLPQQEQSQQQQQPHTQAYDLSASGRLYGENPSAHERERDIAYNRGPDLMPVLDSIPQQQQQHQQHQQQHYDTDNNILQNQTQNGQQQTYQRLPQLHSIQQQQQYPEQPPHALPLPHSDLQRSSHHAHHQQQQQQQSQQQQYHHHPQPYPPYAQPTSDYRQNQEQETSDVPPPQMEMQNYGLYNMYQPNHTAVDPYGHHSYMAAPQPDPRYLANSIPISGSSAGGPQVGGQIVSGPSATAGADGFGGHAALSLPYLSHQEPYGNDYNQSSHRPHATHHHHNLHHPYGGGESPNSSSPSGNSRRKPRGNQIQHQPQQQLPPQQQMQTHPQFYMDPSHQQHLEPHHAMYTQHPDAMYHSNNPNGFYDPNGFANSNVSFDPVTGAPLGPTQQQQGSQNNERSAAAAALVSSIVAVDNGRGNKVYKCPRPLCTKVYKNPNGLKYHLDRGACEVDHDVMEATTGISLHTDDPTALFNLQQQAQQALQTGYEAFPGTGAPQTPTGARDPVGGASTAAPPSSAGANTPQNLTAALMVSDESLKIVHRPYGCKIHGCGKRYQNLNGLKYHAKTAHPGLDFKADVYVLYPF